MMAAVLVVSADLLLYPCHPLVHTVAASHDAATFAVVWSRRASDARRTEQGRSSDAGFLSHCWPQVFLLVVDL
ncbi:hypothetical protein IWX91DRAFT_349904, partial [Phyllosticta citricarpa]